MPLSAPKDSRRYPFLLLWIEPRQFREKKPRRKQECNILPNSHRYDVMDNAGHNEGENQSHVRRRNSFQRHKDILPEIVSKYRVPVLPETSEGLGAERTAQHVPKRTRGSQRHTISAPYILGQSKFLVDCDSQVCFAKRF